MFFVLPLFKARATCRGQWNCSQLPFITCAGCHQQADTASCPVMGGLLESSQATTTRICSACAAPQAQGMGISFILWVRCGSGFAVQGGWGAGSTSFFGSKIGLVKSRRHSQMQLGASLGSSAGYPGDCILFICIHLIIPHVNLSFTGVLKGFRDSTTTVH